MLKDKVVVVTGAGGGIGRDFALAMAAHGAKVVVNDIGASVAGEGKDAGPAQKVVDEIKAKGGTAVANTDSVAEWESANRIIKCAIDSFRKIDVVVNNAGILRDRFFFNMSVEEWKAVIDVHLNGTFYVSRAAAPYFKSQNSGRYINMTSTSGLIGNFGQANYAAAKLGIAALSKSMALDMAKYKVTSNCIAPFAWSRMIGTIPAETPDQKARLEKLKRMETAKIAPHGRLSRERRLAGGDRADFRGARQRDFPDVPEPPAALGAPLRRLDAGNHRGTGDARNACAFLRPGPLAGRFLLGSHLISD